MKLILSPQYGQYCFDYATFFQNQQQQIKEKNKNQNDQSSLVQEINNEINKIYDWIYSNQQTITKNLKSLNEKEKKEMFEEKQLNYEKEIEEVIFNEKSSFFEDFSCIYVYNKFLKEKDFKFLKEPCEDFRTFKKFLKLDKQDIISSQVDIDYLGLILWCPAFADQILDIIYLATDEFYIPAFFYIYLFSFLLSLILVQLVVFNRVYKFYPKAKPNNTQNTNLNNTQVQNANNSVTNSINNPNANQNNAQEKTPDNIQKAFDYLKFIKTLGLSIITWLRVEELIYILGFRKFIRDYFEPEIKVAYCGDEKQFFYNDPKEISKQQRLYQKIELGSEILNQTLLRDWGVRNLAQSSLSFSLMFYSGFKFYVQDNDLDIKSIKKMCEYVLFKFGHVNKILGMIYAIIILIINNIALDQIDMLDDSSKLTIFDSKFRDQIIIAIIAIVVDIIHFILVIFAFKKREDKKDIYGLEDAKFSDGLKLFLFIYTVFVDYFMYAILQATYAYFEIDMYHTFYGLGSAKYELGIMRFRFSYFMLVIFISTFVFHPLVYIPLALYEIPLFIIFVLTGIVYLIIKIFGVDSDKCRKAMKKVASGMYKPFKS